MGSSRDPNSSKPHRHERCPSVEIPDAAAPHLVILVLALKTHISVSGFVPARQDHPSGLRFPDIQFGTAKAFGLTAVRSVAITHTWSGLAELYVVTADGTRLCKLFNYNDVAMAKDPGQWWEDRVRREWEEIKPQ